MPNLKINLFSSLAADMMSWEDEQMGRDRQSSK
jgi:hypothetical protein